jgi:hypothetical protein
MEIDENFRAVQTGISANHTTPMRRYLFYKKVLYIGVTFVKAVQLLSCKHFVRVVDRHLDHDGRICATIWGKGVNRNIDFYQVIHFCVFFDELLYNKLKKCFQPAFKIFGYIAINRFPHELSLNLQSRNAKMNKIYGCGHNFLARGLSELKIVAIDLFCSPLSNEYLSCRNKFDLRYGTAPRKWQIYSFCAKCNFWIESNWG